MAFRDFRSLESCCQVDNNAHRDLIELLESDVSAETHNSRTLGRSTVSVAEIAARVFVLKTANDVSSPHLSDLLQTKAIPALCARLRHGLKTNARRSSGRSIARVEDTSRVQVSQLDNSRAPSEIISDMTLGECSLNDISSSMGDASVIESVAGSLNNSILEDLVGTLNKIAYGPSTKEQRDKLAEENVAARTSASMDLNPRPSPILLRQQVPFLSCLNSIASGEFYPPEVTLTIYKCAAGTFRFFLPFIQQASAPVVIFEETQAMYFAISICANVLVCSCRIVNSPAIHRAILMDFIDCEVGSYLGKQIPSLLRYALKDANREALINMLTDLIMTAVNVCEVLSSSQMVSQEELSQANHGRGPSDMRPPSDRPASYHQFFCTPRCSYILPPKKFSKFKPKGKLNAVSHSVRTGPIRGTIAGGASPHLFQVTRLRDRTSHREWHGRFKVGFSFGVAGFLKLTLPR